MFSGIIAACGRLHSVTPLADGVCIEVDCADLDLGDVQIGDSIANNGVCLTVISMDGQHARFDVSRETLNCTVGLDQPGTAVNLETALRLADRLGGHLVSGHVDGVGTVVRFDPVGDNRLLEISAPEDLAKYIARKGSITVSGVSLTTNAVDGCRFAINLIPHTLASTTLGGIRAGDRVNLEIDLIARYVERMLNPEAEPAQNA